MSLDASIGVDVGGSHITVLCLDIDGNVVDSLSTSLENRSYGMDSVNLVINQLITGIEKLIERINKSIYTISCIGLGIPGNVDPIEGSTRYLPNFGWTETVPLGRLISEHFHVPVGLRNDGRCAALAESKYGAGRKSQIFAMLTLGTGIGGALIIRGQLFDGSTFDAGDFGHHVICSGNEAFQCVCGKSGCFEYHASADGLVRHYNRAISQHNAASDDYATVTNAYDFIQLLRNDPNNSIVKEAFSNYKKDLATGLANLVTFYNPDTICLGGGLAQAPEIFHDLESMIDERTLPATRGKVRIVPATLSVEAGAIGAAIVGFMTIGKDLQSPSSS